MWVFMKKILKIFNPLKSPFAITFYITIIFVVLHFYFINSNIYGGFLGYVERSLEQFKYGMRGVKPITDKVVVIDMDESTLEKYGWPINRKHFADLVIKLKKLGIKSVAFDIIFADPSNNDSIESAKKFHTQFQKISLSAKGELVIELDTIINNQEKNLKLLTAKLTEVNKKIDWLKKEELNKKETEEDIDETEKNKIKNKKQKPKVVIDKKLIASYDNLMKEQTALQKVIKTSEEEILKYRTIFEQLKTLNNQYAEYLDSKANEMLPDKIFAKAIHQTKNVILGYVGFTNDDDKKLISQKRAEQNFDAIISRSEIKGSKVNIDEHTFFVPFIALNAPYQDVVYVEPALPKELIDKINKQIEEAQDEIPADLIDMLDRQDGVLSTEHFGSFNLIPDIDGIARNYYPVYSIEDTKKGKHLIFSLGMAALKVYFHDETNPNDDFLINYKDGIPGLGFEFDFSGKKKFYLDYNQRFVVLNYYGPEKTFKYYSMKDILEDKYTEADFKDKIGVIGTTATGLLDMRSSPFNPSQRYPGVEVHTTFIENVINDDYFRRADFIPIFELVLLFIVGIFSGILIYKFSLYIGLVISAISGGLIFLMDVYFFFNNNMLLYSFHHIFLPSVIFIALTIFKYFNEEKEKMRIKGAFKYYLSKSVVDEVLKDPSKLSLGGVKKDLSVLFSDIRGFTTISEGLTPEMLSSVLNRYLTPMTNIVFKYGGTLDKYMGDAIMAFFGAPIDQPDHAYRCCLTALEMMKELHVLQEEFKSQNLPLIDIGIGVNSGEMSVGNMGSQQRFDYTVMGDNVNLGSRLEGINKQYHTNIIVSEYTYEHIKDKLLCRVIDAVKVKGKKLPVVIYELVGENMNDPVWKPVSDLCKEGFLLYTKQKWDESIEIFRKVLEVKPFDYPAEMYIERCEYFKENPPETGWDGSFTMTTK